MYKLWLSLALGAGLLACGTPAVERDKQPLRDAAVDDDDDENGDEETDETPRGRPVLDGGRDAGKDAGRDASRPDGGGSVTSVVRDGSTPPAIDAGSQSGGGGTRSNQPPPEEADPQTPDPGNGPQGSEPDRTDNSTPDNSTPGTADPAAPASGGELGSGCGGAAACGGSNLECKTVVRGPESAGSPTLSFPGGYCTRGCDADGQCGPGASCPFALATRLPEFSEFSQCVKECSSKADCRAEYDCKTLPRIAGLEFGNGKTFCIPPNSFGDNISL